MKITIYGTDLTAHDAADQFAAKYFGEPRKIGCWMKNGDSDRSFMLTNGRKEYQVRCNSTYDGWDISDEEGTP